MNKWRKLTKPSDLNSEKNPKSENTEEDNYLKIIKYFDDSNPIRKNTKIKIFDSLIETKSKSCN